MGMTEQLVEAYASHLRKRSCTDKTITERIQTLRRANRALPQGLIHACTDELEEWLWRENLAPASRATYYGAINGFFGWAYAADRIDFDPMQTVTPPKSGRGLPNPVTNEEVAFALAHAREPFSTWVRLAAYAGMRCIDISRFRREHATIETLHILRSKGNKARAVPTHPLIWQALRDLPAGPITDLGPREISMSALHYFRRTLKMPGVRMHRFRHWFGTNVQRHYKDLRVTQELLGHTNPASTAGYALVVNEQKTAAVGMLPNLAAAASADDAAAQPEDPALPQ